MSLVAAPPAHLAAIGMTPEHWTALCQSPLAESRDFREMLAFLHRCLHAPFFANTRHFSSKAGLQTTVARVTPRRCTAATAGGVRVQQHQCTRSARGWARCSTRWR